MKRKNFSAAVAAGVVILASFSMLTESTDAKAQDYGANLTAKLDPTTSGARVALRIEQSNSELRELNFYAPPELFSEFDTSAGTITRDGKRVIWTLPALGGTLSWHAALNVPKGKAYDARITKDWALMRFEDLFPPVRSKALKGSASKFFVHLEGPAHWSFETRYGRVDGQPLEIESSQNNFDRPTGWLIAGELGVRREPIAGRAVTVAAPAGTHFPRVPTLAFLRWTLPELERVFPMLPQRLLVVSGNDEMWRGALSGPSSLFVHRERPLISENGTSTLLHELVHVATRIAAEEGDDWIVEGLAEYYSLEVLRRSDGLSEERFSSALKSLRKWSASENGGLRDPSKGVDTAAAALLFHSIAAELERRPASRKKPTNDTHPLDLAIQHLLSDREGRSRISRSDLQESIEVTSGAPSKELAKAIAELD